MNSSSQLLCYIGLLFLLVPNAFAQTKVLEEQSRSVKPVNVEDVKLITTSPKKLKERLLEEEDSPVIQDNLETIGIVSDVPMSYYRRQIEIAELDF